MSRFYLWGGVLLFLVLVMMALLWVPKIKHVNIELPAQSPVSQQEVEQLLTSFQGERFLQLSLTEVQRQLNSHPWVASATVRRVWPSTLQVSVHTQVPVARWGESGLVNAMGEVFFPEDLSGYENLLPLWAADTKAAPALLSQAQWLVQQAAALKWHVISLTRHPGGSVEVHWLPKRTVWMSETHYKMQFKRFVRAWPHVSDTLREQADEIDLRYSNGFTVKQQ